MSKGLSRTPDSNGQSSGLDRQSDDAKQTKSDESSVEHEKGIDRNESDHDSGMSRDDSSDSGMDRKGDNEADDKNKDGESKDSESKDDKDKDNKDKNGKDDDLNKGEGEDKKSKDGKDNNGGKDKDSKSKNGKDDDLNKGEGEDKKGNNGDGGQDGGGDDPKTALKKSRKNNKSIQDKLKKKIIKQLAKKAAALAARAILLQNLLAAMKMLMLMLLQLLTAIVAAVAGIVSAIISAILGFFSSIGSAIAGVIGAVASFLGTAFITTAIVMLGGVFVVGAVVVGVAIDYADQQQVAQRDAPMNEDPCASASGSAVGGTLYSEEGEGGDVSEKKKEQAKKIYDVYRTLVEKAGHVADADLWCAGVLGNLQRETDALDPTCIETINNEPAHQKPYVWDDEKEQYLLGKGQINAKNRYGDGAKAKDGNYYAGIGIYQFTGDEVRDLREKAKAAGQDFTDMGFQTAYMLGSNFHAKYILKNWLNEDHNISYTIKDCPPRDTRKVLDLDDAATTFYNCALNGYVIVAGNTTPLKRRAEQYDMFNKNHRFAEQWLKIIKKEFNANYDAAYGQSILDAAKVTNVDATADSVKDATASGCNKCGTGGATVDNSSVAAAAMSLSYFKEEDIKELEAGGIGKDGDDANASEYKQLCTGLYIETFEKMYKGDGYYASCSQGAGTAIKWAGMDDDFPAGGCLDQANHCKTSDRWELVGKANETDKVQPGDFLNYTTGSTKAGKGGHSMIYIGTAAEFEKTERGQYFIKKGYVDPKDTSTIYVANASFGEHGMQVEAKSSTYLAKFDAYRCIKPQEDSKFKGEVTGQSAVSLCEEGPLDVQPGEAAKVPMKDRVKWLFDGKDYPTTESEMAKYLETVDVNIINESGKKTTMKLTIHKKLKAEIQAIFDDMVKANFKIRSNGDTAAYCWRMMSSNKNKRSHHSYGVCIDVNASDNDVGKVWWNKPYSVNQKVVDIWKAHGFEWGGDWPTYIDPMHFTYDGH